MPLALDTAGLLALFDRPDLVVLPSARAAQALREQYGHAQRARGVRVWEPPPVVSWREWTDRLWSPLALQGQEDRVLLNRLQEETLWTEIITGSAEAANLPSSAVRELARLARSGLALAAAHNALARLPRSADSFDSRAFVSWHRSFAQICATEKLLPAAQLEAKLTEHIRSGRISPPDRMHVVGFDRTTPAQDALLEAAHSAGCEVVHQSLAAPSRRPDRRVSVTLADPREELRWAVEWLGQRFRTSPSPQTVALTLPDPARERAELEPLLRQVLAPELEAIHVDLSSTPWQFSGAASLAALPILQHALLLLRWLHQELAVEDVTTLLLSPFLAHSDAPEARARFERHAVRQANLLHPELSLASVLRSADEHRPGAGAGVALRELRAVERYSRDSGRLKRFSSHAESAEFVRKLLQLAGWPGSRTLSPGEFRATEAWDSLLDLLATLDLRGPRLGYSDFLRLLTEQVNELPAFSIGSSAPIQILRLAETEGCSFDAALVLRATDEHLPPPERPHPLLGWAFQHSLGLPGTNPALTAERTGASLRSLSHRCGDLLLLHSTPDDAGPHLTSLAAELGFQPVASHTLLSPVPDPLSIELEQVPDDTPLPPLPSLQVPGGARVLELQAACGFQAFTSLRLQATLPESVTLGIDARRAGNLLHTAMDLLWAEVKTQGDLKALSTPERDRLVTACVSKAFQRLHISPQAGDRWSAAYLQVQERRLARLIHRWLQYEVARGEFVVLSREEEQFVSVGPLQLKVRPDRMDKVKDGLVLVDYKTSSALKTDDWLGERPDRPQLPLYALLAEPDEVRGIAFARLRPGKDMGWISLRDQEGIFPASKGRSSLLHDFSEQIPRWREELDRLAHDFADGRAEVNPKSHPQTCQYCEQRLLCRLDAATLLAGEDARREDAPDG